MQFIPRKIHFELKKHLLSPEISLILGPRQAGKTTIMKKIADELKLKGRSVIYFDLDVIEDRQYFQTQHTFLEKIQKTLGVKKDVVVFIDEVQRLKNAGLFLKGLYDLQTGHKYIISGSGSLELKSDVIEPMTGRKKIFYCYPLSFEEFAAFELRMDFTKFKEGVNLNPYERDRLVGEYLNFGGYPRVVLASTYKEKIDTLAEIFTSYLEKDIAILLGVEKEQAFEALVRILASQVGNLINRQELSTTLGISVKTVNKYLFFLEKTFVISLVRPFFRNVRKELRKSPKVYFNDLGMLRLARRLTLTELLPISGEVFENACFLRLRELPQLYSPRFWRSTSGAEVDFIIDDPITGQTIPIEVKYSASLGKGLGKSLVSFIKKYASRNVLIYTREEKGTVKKYDSQVRYVPYHELPNFAN